MIAAVRRRAWLPDLLIATCVVGFAGTAGYRYISAHYSCQNCVEDLLYPCFRHFGQAPEPQVLQRLPEYRALFEQKLDTIPCSAVSRLPTAPNGQAWQLQKYLHATLSAVLLTTGPRYAGFHYVQTGMFVLTVLAAYGVFRLGMGPIIAAAVTVPMIVSDFHLAHTTDVADYAKAPFIIAALFFVGLALRRPLTRTRVIGLSLLGGVAVGAGIGFKPDVLVCAPVLAVALVLFLPPLADGKPYRRLTAAAVFLASAIAVSAPVLVSNFFGPQGSLLPVQVLGGMDSSFDKYYTAPPLYDYGIVFDDTYVTVQINSYDQRVYGATEVVAFFSKGMARAATRLLVDLDRVFPADLIVRTLAGILRVLALVPFGWTATAIALAALYATDLRLALCVTFLLSSYVGYVSLVFLPRHYFHLLFVPLWMIGWVVNQGGATLARWLRIDVPGVLGTAASMRMSFDSSAALRGVSVLAAIAVIVWAALAGARVYQQSRVRALIDGYNREDNFVALSTRTETVDGRTRLDIVDGLSKGLAEPPNRYPYAANYLVADVECADRHDSAIVTAYEIPAAWQQETVVPCSTDARSWRLFLPAYDVVPRIRVRGLEWDAAGSLRVRALRKIRDLAATPFLIRLMVPDDWRSQPLYHEFSLAALRRVQPW
jgi:hypothetical protein